MKRVLLYGMILALTLSLTTPVGVVFATDAPTQFEEARVVDEATLELSTDAEQDDPVVEIQVLEDATIALADDTQGPADVTTPNRAQTAEPPIEVVSPPELKPTSPLFITGYQPTNSGFAFVQLYNSSSQIVSLDGWALELLCADEVNEMETRIALDGYIKPRSYVVVAQSAAQVGADLYAEAMSGSDNFKPSALRLVSAEHEPYEPRSPVFEPGVRYTIPYTAAGNMTHARTFDVVSESAQLYGGGLHYVAQDAPLRVVEILANPTQCAPTDTSIACRDYIKLYNPSDDAIDLSDYRLRVGFGNDTPGINNAFVLEGELDAGSYVVISKRDDGALFSIPPSAGFVWLEDRYGLRIFDETEQSYEGLGGAANRGFSWAYDPSSDTWKRAIPNPHGENMFAQIAATHAHASALTPCRSDQYRHPDTNRCRLIVSTDSSLKPCRPDQYRSPETNRCRSITSASAQLTPCRPGQVRNPDTNRCRLAAATTSTRVPCREGQERNPDTNRCRNIRAGAPPAAAFPVDKVGDSMRTFVGWWVLGVIGLLAVGYAAWEWRAELVRIIRKIPLFFRSGR